MFPKPILPGHKATRVNEFIDLILSDWYAPEETQRFLTGLRNVDARARSLFDKDFVDCNRSEQSKLLTELDGDIAAEVKLRRAGTHNRDQEQKPKHFVYMMKQLTLIGYCTSEAGAQAIGYEVIPTEHGGCLREAGPTAGRS